MCKQVTYTFSNCEHRITEGDIEQCGPVRHGAQPPCSPPQSEDILMGELCHDCLTSHAAQSLAAQEANEEAEMQRILEESARAFEAESSRELGMSNDEQVELERALRESEESHQSHAPSGDFDEDELLRAIRESEATAQPPLLQGSFDETELQQLLALSAAEADARANAPKAYLRQKLRYECGHQTDIGPTDIEFDPWVEGLPYIQHDERGLCPHCGGSSSMAPEGRTRVDMAMGSARRGIEEEFEAEARDDVNADEGMAFTTVKRPGTPLPGWTSREEYEGARPDDEQGVQADGQADAAFVREQRLRAFAGSEGAVEGGAAPSTTMNDTAGSGDGSGRNQSTSSNPQAETGDDDDNSSTGTYTDSDEEPEEALPYATVDNLVLDQYTGEQREAVERTLRAQVERLRLEGTLARRDAGDISDPTPERDA